MIKKIIATILTVILVIGMISPTEIQADTPKVLGTLSMNIGETKPLKFTDPNGNAVSVIWESSNPDIATVSDTGMVTGKRVGTVVISAYWNGKLYGVKIVVNDVSQGLKSTSKSNTSKSAKSYSLNKTSASLKKGKTLKLKLKNAKASKVKWKSSNKKVATVSQKGVVKGKKQGTATITAKYNKKSYRCKVTVKATKKKGKKSKKLTTKQAFDKLMNYVVKNGTGGVTNPGVYAIKWEKGGINYHIACDKNAKYIVFSGVSNGLAVNLYLENKSTFRCLFDYQNKEDSSKNYSMALETTISSFVLENMPDFNYVSGDKSNPRMNNMNAQASLQWMFADFDTYIRKKAGISMKQLGFKKWK